MHPHSNPEAPAAPSEKPQQSATLHLDLPPLGEEACIRFFDMYGEQMTEIAQRYGPQFGRQRRKPFPVKIEIFVDIEQLKKSFHACYDVVHGALRFLTKNP
jgi:hypothetical protein